MKMAAKMPRKRTPPYMWMSIHPAIAIHGPRSSPFVRMPNGAPRGTHLRELTNPTPETARIVVGGFGTVHLLVEHPSVTL